MHNLDIREIVLQAGKILSKRYYEKTSASYSIKERYHLLSEVDIELNTFICDKIVESFPNDSVYSEESKEILKDTERRWIIDPIDGTTNFITGNPYFAISIALERNNQIVEGHVYNPISNEYYYATLDYGVAFLNAKIICTSKTSEIEDSILAFGYSANMQIINEYYKKWKILFDNCKKGIPLIAPALSICNVARGKIDAFIDTGSSMEGQSAASLILKTAGGVLSNSDFTAYDHKKKGGIFCCKSIYEKLKAAQSKE
jgi:myo-inositol-1(or 4)-monophosphatase